MPKFMTPVALVGATLTLAACSAGQVASTPPTTTALSGVVCPPAGTVAVRDDGVRVRYAGADPNDPAVCLVRTQQGTARALGGLLTTHPMNEGIRRQALASLFPLAPGRSSTARYQLVNQAFRPDMQPVPFEESFRVVGETVFQTESEERPAWAVEGTLRSMLDTSFVLHSTYTIDKETGAILAQAGTSRAGAVYSARPWRVTELTLPTRR
ncbi:MULTISPECIES: hypothetical protein [Acetobacterales]|jgi:hypothetical protein|uniref:Lipoprotein n=1 Tax=Muricoccus pecuniae TaxID=693023 RepID=A0A840YLD5_9PROT|nr:hypothetical protein [Roseomonas pecuniae]MBB5695902.1 hypothetical protein [Roseomonas pecuniae]